MKKIEDIFAMIIVLLLPPFIVGIFVYVMVRDINQANWLEERYGSTQIVEFVRDIEILDKDEYPKSVAYKYVNNKQSPLFGENKYYSFKIVRFFIGYSYELDAVERQGSSFVYVTGSKKGEKVNLNDDHKISILDLSEPKGEVSIFINNASEAEKITKFLSSENSWFSIIKEQEEQLELTKKTSDLTFSN
ncbi:hypothetical protein ACFVS2_21280 [Brevibacillus sp. NPDC058079]|uniref:hypothetical protein n=1 Tax=Brevibacillus sp. NPDC058079 TaxID=3346330 RepID=UPI0036E5DB91